jgi:hypothetical protein
MVRHIRSAVSAEKIELLLEGLLPSEIMSLDMWARLTWRDAEGRALLEVDLPLVFKPRAA